MRIVRNVNVMPKISSTTALGPQEDGENGKTG